MSALFDVPHPATLRDADRLEPVLWFGISTTATADGRIKAVIVTKQGSVGTCELTDLIADVRYVDELGAYPALGKTGPGWVDLEDMVVAPVESRDLEDVKREAAEALVDVGVAPAEAPAPLVGSDGTRYDPLTNLPMDD